MPELEEVVKEVTGLVTVAAKKAADSLAGMLNTELKRVVGDLPDAPSYRGLREDAAHIEFRSRVAPASEVEGEGESVVVEPVATEALGRPMEQVLGALEYGSDAHKTQAGRFFSGVLAEVNAKLQESTKEVLAERFSQ